MSNEYYTPSKYVESARKVMGSIDLDPASNEIANIIVKAKKYYSKENNGLNKPWYDNVFLNPPYSREEIKLFTDKLIEEIENDHVYQCIMLVNSSTSTNWFHKLLQYCSFGCIVKGRINFYTVEGKTKGNRYDSMFLYFGNYGSEFQEEFRQYGFIF